MESVSIRNLDQIQERDPARRGSRLGTMVVASLAGACVVFAALALLKRPQIGPDTRPDPLAELVKKNAAAPAKLPALDQHDVAFPNLLSDDPNPTTAMAALRKGDATAALSGALPFELPPGAPTAPPPAADRLPVVPLPAQNYLSLSPVVTRPRDSLTAMAQQASTPTCEEAAPGGPGGYQLQVSSFRTEKAAEKFATALRQRGHRAHVESATVGTKGVWYRVRVGPFKTKYQAAEYRREFEKREHIVTFLVEPDPRRATAMRD